jgi:Family of unknown function (DUF6519)
MKGDFSRLSFKREKHTAGVLHQQGRVWLDADWNEEVQTRLDLAARETVDVVGRCGVPKPGTAFEIVPNPAAPGDFFIRTGPGPLGRCYVDGILCELYDPAFKRMSYLHQPDYIDPPAIALPPPNDTQPKNALVYVETWKRLITYLEDPEIREIALNGPDTATRLRTVVQVKVIDVAANVTDCAAAMNLVTDGNGTLTTLPPADDQPPDPCRIPDPGSYTGRENHLYRVEIHDGGDVAGTGGGTLALGNANLGNANLARLEAILINRGPLGGETLRPGTRVPRAAQQHARFKWSKNNAADAVQVLSVSQDRLTLTVQSLGRDLATALVDGNIVEICDDRSELGHLPGHLTTIAGNPDPDRLTITLADPLPPEFVLPLIDPSALSPLSPPFTPANRHATLRRWDGVGSCAAAFDQQNTPDMDLGDGVHIQFGGTDLRPGDYWQFVARSVDGSVERLTNAPPTGIVRHRCPLALVRWQHVRVFEIATLFQLSPASALPSDLVAAIGAHFAAAHETKTDSATLHDVAAAAGATQQELALLDEFATRLPTTDELRLRVVKDCRSPFVPLTDEDDVDKAMHVVRVGRFDIQNNVTPLLNDSLVSTNDVVNGIGVWFDRPVEPHTVKRPACYVEVEIPFPLFAFGQVSTGLATGIRTNLGTARATTPAYQRITLAAELAANQNQLTWLPRGGLQELDAFAALAPPEDRGLLTRLHLRGDVIWSADNEKLFLDGDAFGIANPSDPNQTLLRFPSGDGKRGGDFEMWFWLKAPPRLGLYVIDQKTQSIEFYPLDANGPTAPSRSFGTPNAAPNPVGVAVDATGKIFVASGATGIVAQFDPGATGFPTARATSAPVQKFIASGLAVDANGLVYLAGTTISSSLSSVHIFPNALGAAQRSIEGAETGLVGSVGVAAAADGTTFVTSNPPDGGRIQVFAPNASGNAGPARSIILPTVNVGGAVVRYTANGVAFDATGNLYVAAASQINTAAPDAVFVFPPNQNNPAKTIRGVANTKLFAPFGIAVDAAGNIYVSNRTSSTITVYGPGADGDVAPIRTITGAAAVLTAPTALTIGL